MKFIIVFSLLILIAYGETVHITFLNKKQAINYGEVICLRVLEDKNLSGMVNEG